MISRRGFLGALSALAVTPFLPACDPVIAPLAFHPNAFVMAMEPVSLTRFDVIYGFRALQPEFACRIEA